MRRIAGGVLVLLLGLSATSEGPGRVKPATPAEQYQSLLDERDRLSDEMAKAKTDDVRKPLRARRGRLLQNFLELAERSPKDPVAVKALTQVVDLEHVSAFPDVGTDTPGEKALALLVRDHVRSDTLGEACRHVAFGFHTSRETFLRAVVEQNPHREVQGLAYLSLAQLLNDRANRLDLLEAQETADLARRYHRVFGKEFVEDLQRRDRKPAAEQIETLFDRAAAKYADVKIPVTHFGSGGTVGEKARAELFRIRHLSVGKEAPDIVGEDQDGKRFRLRDYRGKVVLLDFWYHG